MSDLLDTYEQEFQELTFAVSQRIAQIPKLTGAPKSTEIDSAEGELQEAERVLGSMNIRVKSMNAKETVVSRVRGYSEELQKLKKDLKKARTSFNDADRQRLFGSVANDEISVENLDHRSRLLHDIEQADSTSEVIRDMNRNAREGLALGIDTANRLEDQNQMMENLRERLRGVNDLLAQSKKIMNLMWRRTIENKVLAGAIVVLLLLLIIFVIWVKWIHHPSSGGGSNSPLPPTATPSATPSPTPSASL